MKYSKIKLSALFLVVFFFSGLISCTKKSEDTADNMVKEADLETIDKNNVTETDEDLLNVDYREFYDELSPHGEWIEVKGSDIGVDLQKGTSSGESKRSISFSELFGIKDALADDVSLGAFFVWKPAPNLAVGITAGEPQVYTPYSNGQWIHTSNGWYFRAASEPEELTHHYGRWVYSPAMGWVWVPGRVWAPAWVDWREQDDYIAWTPIPPSVYIVNNVITVPPVYEERYIIVERRYFIEPDVYRYTYKENKHKIKITEWRRTDGIMVVNNTVINRGPDVTVIQSVTGKTFEPVVITHVSVKNNIKYSDREYHVYSPEFRKIKTDKKVRGPVSKPKEFSDYQSASQKETGTDNKSRGEDNSISNEKKKNNQDMNDVKVPPENPGINRKYIDDKDMKNGKNNDGNKNRQDNKEDRKSGKDKEKKNNDNSGDLKQKDQKNDGSKGKDKKTGNDKGNKKYKNDSYKDKGNNDGNANDKQKNNNGSSKEQNINGRTKKNK